MQGFTDCKLQSCGLNPGPPAPDSSSVPSKVSYREDVKGSNYEELKRENETRAQTGT